jgi:hypothetical protein
MLKAIQERLGGLVRDTWAEEMTTWGDSVALYGEYYDGDHRAEMTAEMRQMLRISDSRTEQFNDNYCELVVDTMADRLKVTAVEGDNPKVSEWAAGMLDENRFDGLQTDIHQATVRDGDTFLMVAWDNEAKAVQLAHEPAWDGDSGMLVVYDRTRKHIEAAVKVWYEGEARYANIYYPDRVERFLYGDGGSLTARTDDPVIPWTVGVIPVVHFRNRARTKQTLGISELKAAIPMQDALNRTMVSMIMTAELTAFGLRKAKGFVPPDDLAPGKWIYFGADEDDSAKLAAMDAGMMEQGELVPFISQAQFVIDQIGTVTRTPLPGFMGGDAQSGEALKQRETGLLGKVGKFQVKVGNAWEDALSLAAVVQGAFGTVNPPTSERWQCRWQDAQTRNDAEVIANALAVKDTVGEMEFLRLIAAVYGYDEQKIEQIMAEKVAQSERSMRLIEAAQFGRFRDGGAETETDEPVDADEAAA